MSVRLRPGVLIDDEQLPIVNAATAETLISAMNVQPNVRNAHCIVLPKYLVLNPTFLRCIPWAIWSTRSIRTRRPGGRDALRTSYPTHPWRRTALAAHPRSPVLAARRQDRSASVGRGRRDVTGVRLLWSERWLMSTRPGQPAPRCFTGRIRLCSPVRCLNRARPGAAGQQVALATPGRAFRRGRPDRAGSRGAGHADIGRTGPAPSGRTRARLAGDIAAAGRTHPDRTLVTTGGRAARVALRCAEGRPRVSCAGRSRPTRRERG